MKTVSVLLVASAAVNAALVAAFVFKPQLAPAGVRAFLPGADDPKKAQRAPATPLKTTGVAATSAEERADARRSQLWAALDSDDLPTLIKRLRAAGFAPPVVRAIIAARLESRSSDRIKAMMGELENTPYWKPDPTNMPGSNKFWEEYSQLFRERSRVMRELLGDDAYASVGTDPAAAQKRQFGNIPKEKIDLVQRISDDYAEMTSQIRASMQGITLPEDREKIALLERERRADLAAVLTPAELEEYEMRTSPVTSRLRSMLSIMDASAEEFHAIFKVQQEYDDRINPLIAGTISPKMMGDRREAQRQLNEQLKTLLPPDRYTDFLRASNPEFQQLYRISQRENVPAETTARAFSIREAISTESIRIADDATLSIEQKRAALTALAQKGRTQILSTLGPGAGEAYVEAARWLTNLDRGSGFTFGPDGNPVPRMIARTPPR